MALGNEFMLAPSAALGRRCGTKIQLSPGKVNKYRVGESLKQLLKVRVRSILLDPHIIFCTLLINQAWTNIYLAFNNPVIIKMLLINCFVNNACRVIDKRNGALNACYKVVKSTAPPFLWHFKQSSGRASDWCRARMLVSHWSMGSSRLWQGSPGQAELKVANTGHRQPGSPGQHQDATTRAQSS